MAITKRDVNSKSPKAAEPKRAPSAAAHRRKNADQLKTGTITPGRELKTTKRPLKVKKSSNKKMTGVPKAKSVGKHKLSEAITEQETAEDRQAFFASFPDLNFDPILELMQDGSISYQNPACQRLFPDLASLGLKHPFLKHYAAVLKAFGRGHKVGSVIREVVIGNSYYEQRYLSIGLNRVRIYAMDITKRKQAEITLNAAEEALHLAIDNSPLGITIVGKKGEKIYANRAILDMFGFNSLQEFINTPVRNLYTQSSWAESEIRRIKRLSGKPVADGYEISIVRKDGQIRHLQAFRSKVLWEGQLQDEALYQDITERKQAEEALIVSEQTLQKSIELSPLGIRIVDNADNTIYANPTLLRMFDYDSSEEFKKIPLKDRYAPQSYLISEERNAKRNRGEAVPDGYEVSVVHKDGSIHYLQVFRNEVLWEGRLQNERLYQDITENKKSEEALKASEVKYSTLVEQSSDGIVILDKRRIIFANHRMSEISGYPPEQIIGKSFPELFTAESKIILDEGYKKRAASNFVLQSDYELEMRAKNGRIIPVETKAKRVVYANTFNVMVIIRDIMERKTAEQALAASEQLYSALVEQSTDGILLLNDRTIGFANQRMTEITGFSIDELKGKRFPDLFSPEYHQFLDEGYNKIIVNTQALPTYDKLEIIAKDGKKIPVETRAQRFTIRNNYTAMVIVTDLTDRERAEQALRTSEENFRNSIENSPLGVRIVNKEGQTLYTNKALLDIYGYRDLEEFNTTPVNDRYTPESFTAFRTRMEKRRLGEPLPDNYDVSIMRKDGTVRQLQVNRKEVLWGGKQEFLNLYVDITQRNQMMTILNELNSILQLMTNINKLIVKLDDEAELLQQACDQFVTNRRYALGWIGLIQAGTYEIVPSAMAGKDIDYLSGIRITWDESEYSQGPTGVAVRTGKPSVVRDIARDPRFTIWRDSAVKKGFKSTASLPLVIQDKVIGIVCLYSSAVDAFNEKEIYLLGELAGDLSLGIEKIRRRQAQLKLEQTLRQERDRAQTYLDIAAVMMVVVDVDGNISLINRRGCEILGYDAAEIIGKNWFSNFLPERKRESSFTVLRLVLSGEIQPIRHYENQILTRDGRERTIDWYSVEMRDEHGNITGVLSSGEDITERKKAEAALIASEQNFRNSIDSTFIGWYIVDADWKALYVNQAFMDIFGYKNIDEVRTTPPKHFYTPESKAYFQKRRDMERRGEKVPEPFDIDIVRIDGAIRHLQILRRQVLWDGTLHNQISYHDITERKQAEEALRLSEQNFRNSVDNSVIGIFIIDAEWKPLYCNKAFMDIFGYHNFDEVKITPPSEYYTRASQPAFLHRKDLSRRGEKLPDTFEVDIIRKDGVKRQLQVFRRQVLWDGQAYDQVLYNDITERKLAEEALKLSEQNFRNSIDSSPMGIRITDIEDRTLYLNQSFLNTFGYSNIDEVLADPPLAHYTKESYAEFLQRKEKRLSGQQVPDEAEIDIARKDGSLRHVQIFPREVFWDGKPQFQTIYNDITERKQAEEALRESEEKYRLIVENSSDVTFTINPGLDFIYISPSVNKVLGYDQSQLIGRPFSSIIHPDDLAIVKESIQRDINEGFHRPNGIEYRLLHASGEWRWHNGTGTVVRDDNGKLISLIGVSRDVTERVKAEKALRESEEKYRLIVENSRDIIFTLDPKGVFLYISPSIQNVLGYGQNDLLGRQFSSIIHPDDLTIVLQSIQHNLRTRQNIPGGIEFRVRHASGEWRWQNGMGTVVIDDSGTFTHFIGVVRDITERRQIEKALEESEEKYRLIVENSQDIIFTLNATGEFVYVSPSIKNVLGYTQEQLIGRHYLSLVHPEDAPIIQAASAFNDTVTGEYHSPDIQYRMRHFSGEWRWISSKGTIMRDQDHNFINFIGIADDITERKQAEQALQESEEKYRLIVENSQDIIFTLNGAGEFIYVSPSVKNILGYSRTELIGCSFNSLVHPDDRHIIQDASDVMNTAPGEYHSPDIQYRIRHSSGEWRWISSKGTIMRNEGPNSSHFIGIANDITNRIEVERALQESEEKYRLIVENSQDIIFTLNAIGEFVYVSPSINIVLGYNPAELIGQPFLSIIMPEDTQLMRDTILQTRAQQGSYQYPDIEFRVRHRSGGFRWLFIKSTVMRDKNQQFLNFLGIANDITERKKTEEALKASEENFRNSMDTSITGIRISDMENHTMYANKALMDIFGYSNIDEVETKPPHEFYTPESYAGYLERNKRLQHGEPMPPQVELDILRKDGSIRHLRVSMKEIMWDRNQRYQTIYTDITEDKKAEQEKQRIEEKAQVASRLAAMGEMAAGIAHEINNPLTGVLGFSQIMISKENIPEDIKDDLRLIAESSQRVADIVKRLLTFARQAKPVKSFVNLNDLIDNTLKLRDYVLKTANIEVVTRLDPKLPWSYVDPGQLQQVFLNLIVNAEQAMKEAHGKGTLTISTETKDNVIRIVFQDDGPGISKENLIHLFEPFFTTKAPGEGTGLGLSLSRSIILEHEGKMNVESEVGHGAAFIIELPVIEIPLPSVAAASPVVKPKPTVTRKGKIMVVDDEPVVRSTLAKVLTRMGHTVDAIADARKAIEKLDSGAAYDLILSDVRMPGMNGIELYSRILEKAPAMKNKIIFITGDVMGVDIKTFLSNNNLPYLAKPFDIELLKEKTNMIIMAGQSGDSP